MPAFVATYSQSTRQALYRVVIDQGMSVRAALRAAQRGELAGESTDDQRALGQMGYGYACQLVSAERQERGAIVDVGRKPEKIARDIAVRILRRAERDATNIAAAHGKSSKAPMNTDSAAKTLKVAREAMALLRDLEPKTSSGKAAPAAKRPQSLAARIAAGADSAAGNATPTTTDNGNHGATGNAARSESDAQDETDGSGNGAARSSATAFRSLAADV
jgi:hypothetical protein